MGLIQKRTFQLKCYANETFKYIAKVESTVELALIGALYLFYFPIHRIFMHNTTQQYPSTLRLKCLLPSPNQCLYESTRGGCSNDAKYDTVRLKIAL